MATISAGILCDYAQVRENLLFVVAGGVSRAFRPEVPAGLGVTLALLIDIPYDEISLVHEVEVVVKQNETAQDVARLVLGFQAGGQMHPGETMTTPLVVPLHAVIAPAYGSYDIHVSIDGSIGALPTLYVTKEPPPQPMFNAPPPPDQ